jgi:hypothetical protein
MLWVDNLRKVFLARRQLIGVALDRQSALSDFVVRIVLRQCLSSSLLVRSGPTRARDGTVENWFNVCGARFRAWTPDAGRVCYPPRKLIYERY